TAMSFTRNERHRRTAGKSPACTNRYTVIFETRIISATSATVRKVPLSSLAIIQYLSAPNALQASPPTELSRSCWYQPNAKHVTHAPQGQNHPETTTASTLTSTKP